MLATVGFSVLAGGVVNECEGAQTPAPAVGTPASATNGIPSDPNGWTSNQSKFVVSSTS